MMSISSMVCNSSLDRTRRGEFLLASSFSPEISEESFLTADCGELFSRFYRFNKVYTKRTSSDFSWVLEASPGWPPWTRSALASRTLWGIFVEFECQSMVSTTKKLTTIPAALACCSHSIQRATLKCYNTIQLRKWWNSRSICRINHCHIPRCILVQGLCIADRNSGIFFLGSNVKLIVTN